MRPFRKWKPGSQVALFACVAAAVMGIVMLLAARWEADDRRFSEARCAARGMAATRIVQGSGKFNRTFHLCADAAGRVYLGEVP